MAPFPLQADPLILAAVALFLIAPAVFLCFRSRKPWPQADRFIRAYRDAGFRVVGHLAFPKRYTSATKYLRYQHECAHLLAETFSAPDSTVLDPFSGSGSTLLAAKMLGRNYIGMELDGKYHAIAQRRLAE
jgi:adenine-specific DNA-methyltransferase